MAISKVFNNTTYSIPTLRSESGWETTLSTYLQALADNAATTTFNKQAVRKATASPVTVSASTDCTIVVDLAVAGASTVNLPAGADKQIFIIVDGKGDASTNNITIDANGSETIEGSLTKVIRLNRECLVLQYSSSAGDWKVIGGYVPNMVGGPASATDNAIVRFDGTTGKLVQNSDCTISDTGALTAGPNGGTGANHTFYTSNTWLRTDNATSSERSGANFQFTSGPSGRLADLWLDPNGANASGGDYVALRAKQDSSFELHVGGVLPFVIDSSGAVTLGPSNGTGFAMLAATPVSTVVANSTVGIYSNCRTTSGVRDGRAESTYTGGAIECQANAADSTGVIYFYANKDNDGVDTTAEIVGQINALGAWTFGTSSGTTEFGHSMTGYRTTATTSVLYIRNRETTTASDDAYDIICNKGSTTNTSSQGFIAFYVNDGGTPSGHITANGAGAATFNSFSDLRLKENVQPLQGELLKILSLNPVEFDYKDGSGHQIGFIAQEVEQVYPDTINVLGETEKMKTIAGWDKTSARLVKAIQELKAELDAAKARIETLENK